MFYLVTVIRGEDRRIIFAENAREAFSVVVESGEVNFKVELISNSEDNLLTIAELKAFALNETNASHSLEPVPKDALELSRAMHTVKPKEGLFKGHR